MSRKLLLGLLILIATVGLAAESTLDLTAAKIAIADVNDKGQVLAAKELAKHLNLISGVTRDDRIADKEFATFLVGSRPASGKVPTKYEAFAKSQNGKVYFWGGTSDGVAFAVYGFLEKVCGVRWVSPGDAGIVFRAITNVKVPSKWSYYFTPPLQKTGLRGCGDGKFKDDVSARWDKYLPMALRGVSKMTQEIATDNYIWKLRMRHQTKEFFSFGHAFCDWNKRFYSSHPEYLAMDEKGIRGTANLESSKSLDMKLCVSNDAVVDQVIADWVKRGKPKYLNICPTDAKWFCHCDKCCALDCPLTPDEPFVCHKTDRYVNFWNRVTKKAMAIRPDVVVCTYIYESYRKPPRKERIECGDNMLFGVVLLQEDDNETYIREWKKAGMRRFLLRPNSLCYRGVLPRGFERFYFNNLEFAIKQGMIGCDYDGNIRAITDFESYVVARKVSDTSVDFDTLEREFLSQYGAAAPLMKEYFYRVRQRGEAMLVRRQQLPDIEKEVVGDDSQLVKGFMEMNPIDELEEDLKVLQKANSVEGLSEVEKSRVNLKLILAEHALKTKRFVEARDTKSKREFADIAFQLIDYRIKIGSQLGAENWGRIFRAYPCEVRWWRNIGSIIKRKYPEMELND